MTLSFDSSIYSKGDNVKVAEWIGKQNTYTNRIRPDSAELLYPYFIQFIVTRLALLDLEKSSPFFNGRTIQFSMYIVINRKQKLYDCIGYIEFQNEKEVTDFLKDN